MNPDRSYPATSQAGRQYYPALDGLRGVAILFVVVYHNFGFINYFFFGWLGVDLFFVLSGFLITEILLKTYREDNYLKNFYIRRILRIFPLYYLSLIIFLLILPKFQIGPDSTYYVKNQVWLWTYLQNWLYILKPGSGTQSLHHLWSLAVEEQFYLLWPFVILLVRSPRWLLFIIIMVLLSVIILRLWVWNTQMVNFSYFNLYTFSRIDGICIGCIVALLRYLQSEVLKKYISAVVLFFAAANFIFFFINRENRFHFPYLAIIGYTTFAMLFGLLVNEAVKGESRVINFLFNIPLLKFFGKISYGLYIIHWPLYLILMPQLQTWISKHLYGIPVQLVVSILASLLAILLSWLSYRYYERFFLKLKQQFS